MIPPNTVCNPDGLALAFTNPEATNVPDYPLLFADIENSCLGGHYDWCQDRCAQDIQPFENAAFPYVQLQSDVPPNIGGGVTATLGTITYEGKHYLTVWTPNLHPHWTVGQDDDNPSGAWCVAHYSASSASANLAYDAINEGAKLFATDGKIIGVCPGQATRYGVNMPYIPRQCGVDSGYVFPRCAQPSPPPSSPPSAPPPSTPPSPPPPDLQLFFVNIEPALGPCPDPSRTYKLGFTYDGAAQHGLLFIRLNQEDGSYGCQNTCPSAIDAPDYMPVEIFDGQLPRDFDEPWPEPWLSAPNTMVPTVDVLNCGAKSYLTAQGHLPDGSPNPNGACVTYHYTPGGASLEGELAGMVKNVPLPQPPTPYWLGLQPNGMYSNAACYYYPPSPPSSPSPPPPSSPPPPPPPRPPPGMLLCINGFWPLFDSEEEARLDLLNPDGSSTEITFGFDANGNHCDNQCAANGQLVNTLTKFHAPNFPGATSTLGPCMNCKRDVLPYASSLHGWS